MRNPRVQRSLVVGLLVVGGIAVSAVMKLRTVAAMPAPSGVVPPSIGSGQSSGNLQGLIHHNFGPQLIDTLKPVASYTIDARAWRDPNERVQGDTGNGKFAGRKAIDVEIRLRHPKEDAVLDLSEQNTTSWRIEDESLIEEWDLPPSKDEFAETSFSQKDGGGTDKFEDEILIGYAAPSPDVQHWVRVTGLLRRHDTLKERVTFHNVPVQPFEKGWLLNSAKSPLKQRTPNGVRVTLFPLTEGFTNGILTGDRLNPTNKIEYQVGVGLSDHHSKAILPMNAIPVSDNSSECESSLGRSERGVTWGTCEIMPSPQGNRLKSISFSVREDETRESIPFTLTLPVKAGRPKDVWFDCGK